MFNKKRKISNKPTKQDYLDELCEICGAEPNAPGIIELFGAKTKRYLAKLIKDYNEVYSSKPTEKNQQAETCEM